jgi:hypothetical protein
MRADSFIPIDWRKKAEQLRRDGYCVVPGVLTHDFVQLLREAADALGKKSGDSHRSQGSMVGVRDLRDPIFGQLIVSNDIRACFDNLGLDGAAFWTGFVISKPPRSPRLFWHFDWYWWDDPISYEREPSQVFAMYYLVDTRPENGCLRVIPGSHMRRHPLHDVMKDGHLELRKAEDLARPEFADWPEEVSVCAMAGDVVLGDARLLHAAHANDSEGCRSLITLWYHPHFLAFPERLKATFRDYQFTMPETWPEDIRAEVARIRPDYQGDAKPLDRTHYGPRRT